MSWPFPGKRVLIKDVADWQAGQTHASAFLAALPVTFAALEDPPVQPQVFKQHLMVLGDGLGYSSEGNSSWGAHGLTEKTSHKILTFEHFILAQYEYQLT